MQLISLKVLIDLHTCIKIFVTGENKMTIRDAGIAELVVKMEREWLGSKDFEKHQAGFCSQWLLDNTCKYMYVRAQII